MVTIDKLHQPTTLTQEQAELIAAALTAGDADADGWTYEAVPIAGGWQVFVTDEDGYQLGAL